jgi:integrase
MKKGRQAEAGALATRSGALKERGDGGFLSRALAGQLSPHTQRAYARDIAAFLNWVTGERRTAAGWQVAPDTLDALRSVDRAAVLEYRADLARGCATLTVNRNLAVIRSVFAEAVAQEMMEHNPAAGVNGLKVNGQYQATPGLSRSQARALVAAPDHTTLRGLRDRALLHLGVRCGLRCAEIASLRVGDLGEDKGHHVLRFQGKGGKLRRVKVLGDVWRDLRTWIEQSGRRDRPEAPLFVAVRKVGRGAAGRDITCEAALTTVAISGIVKRHLRGVLPADQMDRVGPHALRTTCARLAHKGGASLRQIQLLLGHADSRTTERYLEAADDLDDNAADYVRLSGED